MELLNYRNPHIARTAIDNAFYELHGESDEIKNV